jgi:phosphate transport system substrate-binding protein
MRKTAALLAALSAFVVAATGFGAGNAGASVAHALIQGSGSSWAGPAINQWISDVQSNGMQVVFTPSGSAQGRKDFASKTVDFAVSDIGFQGKDPTTQADDTSQGRNYAYLPIVAGGTALPYHIEKNGQLVRNLRLSGDTLAKIFTNKITNWNDKQITDDNHGVQMPNLPIIPVVHSEGSGSTYQFTRYLWKEYPQYWNDFGGAHPTEYFPRQGAQIAENGSDSSINFITSGAANGAIGYDEYSYALGKNYPVVKVLNKAGYYTLPTQYNVAVALTKAIINTDKSSADYLLQDLDDVYTYNDPRVYPISSYSYAVIPTSPNPANSKMTTAKRQTLADYLYLSVCQGQTQMGPIGYSPLPVNLVQASFDQIGKLKQADNKVDISNANVTTCHNPTFIAGKPKENCLARIAPPPPPCDRGGTGPCPVGPDPRPRGKCVNLNSSTGGGIEAPTPRGGGNGDNGGGGGRNQGGPGGTTPTGGGSTAPAGATGDGPISAAGPTASVSRDPLTGQLVGSNTDPNAVGAAQAAAQASNLGRSQSASTDLALEILAGVLLVGLLVGPPLVARRMKSR